MRTQSEFATITKLCAFSAFAFQRQIFYLIFFGNAIQIDSMRVADGWLTYC